MRLAGIGMTIEGAEGAKSPPLPFIEVADNEGEALLALYPKGLAVVVDNAAAEAEASRVAEEAAQAEAARSAAEAEASRVAEEAAQAEAARSAAEAEAARVAAEGADEPTGPHQHAADLVDAFELLDAENDLVKTGARVGKPKIGAMKDILERDVTAEEIDAAWDAKQAAA